MVRGQLKYQQELLADALDDLKPLLVGHWEEIARNRDFIPLDPDYDTYLRIEATGMLRVYTVRADDGAVVGYAIYFVRPHLHYRRNVWAVSDIVYLRPEYRRGFCGVRLLSFAEKKLTEDGVHVMHTTSKLAHPALARVLEHLGHNPIEMGHAKVLNKEA